MFFRNTSCNRFMALLLCAVAVAATSACGHKSSKAVPTEEIFPEFEVRTDAAGNSLVSSRLMSDFFTFVDLKGGDQIVVTGGGASATLGKSATIATGNAADTPFRFDFQRPKKVDAPNSNGTLPMPMAMTAPTTGSTYSAQNDSITVNWSSFGGIDAMSAEINASCRTFTGSKPVDVEWTAAINGDVGFAMLSLDSLADRLAPNCSVYDAAFTLRRSRSGTLDAAYGPTDECRMSTNCVYPATSFLLRQVRSVPIVINNTPSS